MYIKSIRIKNFRSIIDETIKLDGESLSVFVGRNDAGKSNVLRALNLFFNGKTDHETPYRFDDDYSFNATSGKGKAKEIYIELTIQPPKRLKGAQELKWAKHWRAGLPPYDDDIKFSDGTLLSSRKNGVWAWLQKLKFRYVPAEKSIGLIRNLMAELHDALVVAHEAEFHNNTRGFIEKIQEISSDVAAQLTELVDVPNAIQSPSDFRRLFSFLDFGETHNGKIYLLEKRGDGIKAWHIPVILKVIAQKEKEITRNGYVRPDTIWGFEEPENNLEMANAFKLSDQFATFSKDIQIFLTTHSPAFYTLPNRYSKIASRYYLAKDADRVTRLLDADEATIDREMGILDLISPHVSAANAAVTELQRTVDGLSKKVIEADYLVLCEDEITDKVKLVVDSSIEGTCTFETYAGKDNILGAFQYARILRRRKSPVKIIVHRDRDYLDDGEIEILREKASKANCTLFLTIGTDIESHFLNAAYIASLGKMDEARAQVLINDATKATRGKSVDKISGSIRNLKVSEYYKRYDSNPEIYRHGKTVLKKLQDLYKKETKENLTIQASEYLRVATLSCI